MLRTCALAASVLVLVSGVTFATVLLSSGPPASRTGAPATSGVQAELDCSGCHARLDNVGNPINNVNLPGGAVEIVGLPATYVPGQTYPVGVRLWSDSTTTAPGRKWGFELTAFRTSDGHGTGTFVVTASDLQIKTGLAGGPFTSRSYVEHRSAGTRTGLPDPVTWDFQWQAPASAEGNVLFCVAGNAADGLGTPDNDNIYTSTVLVRDGVTPITSTTWGALKQRFR
jgi:hypothetical protein